jgi:hypothetical protein
MFGASDTEIPTGVRALVQCAECDTPLAGVDTIATEMTDQSGAGSCLPMRLPVESDSHSLS